ncbi:DNA repair protein RAD5 [Fistulifera solaris]|uniref:DNA repair protein RAD5 n=1 Tax=Fistulifera solaris TaxID=1519565 RepID=A0A1Z5KRG6_FISSO|nr:DNA repair protein RAD5 [Fistulifera solaris]|eukprot:GAX28913.1 DNA repair protein RAD5 [Fistulifera solaris]
MSGSSSILEKIQLLRNFCGDAWNDADYTDCLRQNGYNVEQAAECLVTGRYTSKSSNPINLSSPPPKKKKAAFSKERSIVASVQPRKSPPRMSGNWMLLCNRWISNAINTARNGQTGYQEDVTISASPNKMDLRFQGDRAEGKMPDDLTQILVPLLRENCIRAEGKFLMAEKNLPIGAHVPLTVQIFVDVDRFFAVFDGHEETALSAFASKQRQAKPTSWLSSAAFGLLQWAEHGNTPDFSKMAEEVEEGAEWNEADEDDDEADDRSTAEVTSDTGLNLEEAEQPEGFTNVTLRPYQKQALHWMWHRETASETQEEVQGRLELLSAMAGVTNKNKVEIMGSTENIVCDCGPVQVALEFRPSVIHHPLWSCRFLASPDMTEVKPFYVHELLGVASITPPRPPRPCSGGILADAMGLGKTVMLLALLLKGKQERNEKGTTIVVAKLSLLPQWEQEIKTKSGLTPLVYYGSSGRIGASDFEEVDVVVTTYGTLQAEVRNPQSAILSFQWQRVILDEAHCIRNSGTVVSKACCQLQAPHRWCVTGTVIQNSLEDVYGMMKFLRHEPWCIATFWKAAITNATSADTENPTDGASLALDRVRHLLGPILLRRTKDSVALDGNPILTLPPKDTKTIRLDLTDSEREFYQAILARSQAIFEGFIHDGKAATSYMQIFGMLQRLRQVCDHIGLTVQSRFRSEEKKLKKSPVDDGEILESNEDALGKDFLNGLLNKFCSKQHSNRKQKGEHEGNESPKKARLDESYLSQVTIQLSKIVADKNATHLNEECSICLEAPRVEDTVLTPCAHIFCRACLVGSLQRVTNENNKNHSSHPASQCPDGECPNCSEPVSAQYIVALTRLEDGTVSSRFLFEAATNKPSVAVAAITPSWKQQEETSMAARQILTNAIDRTESSKIRAIMDELNNIWQLDPGSKVLAFSHYLGFLDLLEIQFRSVGIGYYRLDGSLSLKERMAVLEAFATAKGKGNKGVVLLMSMMAGAEGLNLVSASSCLICDPWWNQAKEDQCINRIHRIGQQAKVVRIRRFIVNNSVEERILELQHRKKFIADEIYNSQKRADTVGGGTARLGLDDFKLIFRR